MYKKLTCRHIHVTRISIEREIPLQKGVFEKDFLVNTLPPKHVFIYLQARNWPKMLILKIILKLVKFVDNYYCAYHWKAKEKGIQKIYNT